MPTTQLRDFLDHVNRGALIEGGSEHHRFMHHAAQEALRVVAELNNAYRTPQQVRALGTARSSATAAPSPPSTTASTPIDEQT